jgi:hypothetical protein
MSTQTVRSALVNFLRTIPTIARVYNDMPTFISGGAFNLTPVLDSTATYGAVAFPALADTQESRITVPAVTGQKQVQWQIAIVVLYQFWSTPDSQYDDWVGPLDDVLESVVQAIRANPTLGAPDVIFQGGEDDGDIHIARDIPSQSNGGGQVTSWNQIDLHVTEIITA